METNRNKSCGIFDSSMDIFRVYIFNDIRKYIKKMKKSENNACFIAKLFVALCMNYETLTINSIKKGEK